MARAAPVVRRRAIRMKISLFMKRPNPPPVYKYLPYLVV